MRLLLDTHVLLWTLRRPERIAPTVLSLLLAPENEILFSAVSIWEIAIKARLQGRGFDADPYETLGAATRTGFIELPLDANTAARVADLPLHHADPFDRLLVAQAMAGPARLVTADRALEPYSELVMLFRPLPA